MIIAGIDPGVKKSAVGIINGKNKAIFGGFVYNDTSQKIYETFNRIWKKTPYDLCIIEQPDRVDQKSTLKDILNLMYVVGALSQHHFNLETILVKPLEWKGQTPKDVTQNRVLEKIKNVKQFTNRWPQSIRHNLFDAFGLALYGAEKCQY